jgi:hypothetical protein
MHGNAWWIIIPLAAFVYAAYEAYLKNKRRLAEIKATGESVQVQTLIHTVEKLQQRVAVLEQLAIDPSRRLAEDIERLR